MTLLWPAWQKDKDRNWEANFLISHRASFTGTSLILDILNAVLKIESAGTVSELERRRRCWREEKWASKTKLLCENNKGGRKKRQCGNTAGGKLVKKNATGELDVMENFLLMD